MSAEILVHPQAAHPFHIRRIERRTGMRAVWGPGDIAILVPQVACELRDPTAHTLEYTGDNEPRPAA